MRRALTFAAVAGIMLGAALPAALGKKRKIDTKALLHSLQTVYVEGSSAEAFYVRQNLSRETCLKDVRERSDADAILKVWEETPVSCGGGNQRMPNPPGSGGCSYIQAKLLDRKTKKLLWFTEDRHLPSVGIFQHPTNQPYEWILWSLNNSCCKGRPATGSP